MNRVVLIYLAFALTCVAAQKCIQTSPHKYDCPPFPAQHQPSPGIEANMKPRPDYGRDSYNGSGKLTGKVALITGGDSGIGRAVAVAFAREGADIAISYLNEDVDAQETKTVVEASGRKCLLFPGDITNLTNVKAAVEGTVKVFGRIDILVNNAGWHGTPVTDFLDITRERVMYTFQTNVIASFDFARLSLPYMRSGSSIINTASIQAYDPTWGIVDYSSTKGALVTFTKGLAKYAITKGIRVNAVAPGPVWTPLIVQAYSAEKVTTFGEDNNLGRPAQPAELAPAFVHLASDEASFTTGQILGVTGGMLLN